MKTLERGLSENEKAAKEIQGFRRALDQSYAQLREKARAQWQRRYAEHDPSDDCVSVRIEENRRQRALTL